MQRISRIPRLRPIQERAAEMATVPEDDAAGGLVLYWSACYVILFWVVCAVLVGLLLLMTECTVSDVC